MARARAFLPDAVLALTLFFVSYPWHADGVGWSLPLVGLQTIPLIWRRFVPVSVLVVVTAAFIAQEALLTPVGDLSGGGPIVAVYSVAAHRQLAVSLPIVVVAVAAEMVAMAYGKERPLTLKDVLLVSLIFGSAWLGGTYVRSRRRHADALEAKTIELERRLEESPSTYNHEPGELSLTSRELEVVQLVARGLSNAEIAGELFVSETTVKTHVARIFTKLDLRNRSELVALAYERGLVQPQKTG